MTTAEPSMPTTVTGFVELEDGTPIQGARVSTNHGASGVTASGGSFSISARVPSSEPLVVFVEAVVGAKSYSGSSSAVLVAPGQITDVGRIVVDPGVFGPLFPEPELLLARDTRSMTSADLDGDKDIDLAVLSIGVSGPPTGKLSVFRNDGDGTYSPAEEYTLSPITLELAAADLDGDKDVDLAVTGQAIPTLGVPGTVSILRNEGDGTFASPVTYTAGAECSLVIPADFDGDGDIDLATGNSRYFSPTQQKTVSILRNPGDGTFGAPETYSVGSFAYLATLDAEGDGDVDLAVAQRNPTGVLILRNDGLGTFGPEGPYGPGSDTVALVTGDLDGDGDADIAIANRVTLTMLTNLGNGTFTPPVTIAVLSFVATALAADDWNGDGSLDLILSTVTGPIVFSNEGLGTFTQVGYDTGGTARMVTGDLDGDEDVDLAALMTSPSTRVRILVNDHDRLFETKEKLASVFSPQSLRLAHLDADGDLDLVFASLYENSVHVYHNDDGTLVPNGVYATGSRPVQLATADLDADGDLDLGVANSDGDTVSILRNEGNSVFGPHVEFAAGIGPHDIAAGDLDGDGVSDLALINGNGSAVLLNDGSGAFAPPVPYSAGHAPNAIATGDLDRDGDIDLAVANESLPTLPTSVGVLLNRGDGTYAQMVRHGSGRSVHVVLEDLNADGSLDVALTQVFASWASVLLNRGDATFGPELTYPTGTAGTWIAPGDLDGDGDVDLAIATDLFESTVSLLRNNGLGVFGSVAELYAAVDPQSIASGDIDGDRDIDLVTGNWSSSVAPGTITVYWNRLYRKPRIIDGLQDPFVIDPKN